MFTNLKPEVVLFDFYETLLNIWTDEETPVLWDNLARFLQYQGLSVDPKALQENYRFLARQHLEQNREEYPEINVFDIFRTLILKLGYSGSDKLITTAAQLFRVLSIRHFELFPDTLPTLQFLHQKCRLGLVTDAQRVFLEPELKITGLQSFFDVIIVSSDYSFHKPDPRMFKMALEKLPVVSGRALYVGDSWARDIIGAKTVGLKTILVNRKNHFYQFEDSQGPDQMIRSLDELRTGNLF
jgi:putative hydrolase of the HAD superfamily